MKLRLLPAAMLASALSLAALAAAKPWAASDDGNPVLSAKHGRDDGSALALPTSTGRD